MTIMPIPSGEEPFRRKKTMYRLRVKSEFDAAHKMDGYQGKCSQLHGHTYTVEVFVLAKKQISIGISFDLRTLKQKLAGYQRAV